MPELETVVEQKTAGFVDKSYNRSRRKAKLAEEEKELEELMKAQGRGSRNEQAEPSSESVEDAEVQTSSDTQQEEANTESEAQEENLNAEEKTYKKRYSDLRTHMNKQAEEIKQLKETLANAGNNGAIKGPASDESIEAWANKYPEIASIVETIAEKKAEAKFANADARLRELDKIREETDRNKAENTIREAHSDFDTLRQSDKFHEWAGEQPKWVQDALYENADDPASVIRVIDLYKVDQGDTPSDYRNRAKDAAKSVSKGQRTAVDAQGKSGTFRESQVNKMSAEEFERNMDAIDKSIREGKFIYDLSGGAR
jgi:DNA repair exonuclease SbcCD ATPase subunit